MKKKSRPRKQVARKVARGKREFARLIESETAAANIHADAMDERMAAGARGEPFYASSKPSPLEERGRRVTALGMPPPWWRVFARRRWLQRYRAILATDVSQMAQTLREVYSAASIEEMSARPAISMLPRSKP